MPSDNELRRLREAITRFCVGVAILNIVILSHALVEFATR